MLALGRQKTDALTIAAVAIVTACAAALSVAAPALLPWSFVALAAAALMLCWSLTWEITAWAWLWVFSYGLLDWPQWRIELPGFFNLTVPRLIFLAGVVTFLGYFLLHRVRVRFDGALLWAMLVLLAYCAASATSAGWQARTQEVRSAPYFRYVGSLLFPYVMFFLVYTAARGPRQFGWAAAVFVTYGWYALYLAYLQYAAVSGHDGARMLIWPSYVNDPTYGIHFDRARGAFAGAGPQAVLMVLLFYVDLFVARRTRGWARAICLLQAVFVPPAIFFTGLRSAYLAFLLCGVVWLLLSGRRRFGATKLAAASVVLLAAVFVFWSNLTQTERRTGGVAQRGPVVARVVLLRQTLDMVRRHPLTGVGFGHFVDAQQQLQRDPASLAAMSSGVLVEHNLFLNMAAETGLIGVALMLLVFVLVFGESLKLWRRLPAESPGFLGRGLVVLFWVALTNYLTDAMFRDPLWDVFSNGLFWSLAGLVVGYNRVLASEAPGATATDGGPGGAGPADQPAAVE